MDAGALRMGLSPQGGVWREDCVWLGVVGTWVQAALQAEADFGEDQVARELGLGMDDAGR